MSDGFWGALIGALITGTAGITVILLQFNQEKRRFIQQSKKEIKYFIYFTEKFLIHLSQIITYKNKIKFNQDKLNGYTIIGLDDNDHPITVVFNTLLSNCSTYLFDGHRR